jgi:hypothetical protein
MVQDSKDIPKPAHLKVGPTPPKQKTIIVFTIVSTLCLSTWESVVYEGLLYVFNCTWGWTGAWMYYAVDVKSTSEIYLPTEPFGTGLEVSQVTMRMVKI